MRSGTAERYGTDTTSRPRRWRRVMMQIITASVGLVVLAVVVLLLFGEQFAGWAGLPLRPDPELQDAIESAFERAEGDDMVVFADVTDFEWDAVGVFHPYFTHDGVVEEMGVHVPHVVTNNTQLEGHCLLVFRRDDRMVGWTTVRRNVAECRPDEGTGVHSRDEARFVADSFEPAAEVNGWRR